VCIAAWKAPGKSGSMPRTPPRGSAWATASSRAEVKARPDLLPFQDIGNGRKWYWMDLVVYAYLRSQGRVIGTEAPPPPALKNQPGGGKAEKS
jgi:hypothetical protein